MTATILERKPVPLPQPTPAREARPGADGVDRTAPILWHHLPVDQVLPRLAVELRIGLSADEVQRRQAQHGPNRLTGQKRKSELVRFLLQFHQPLLYILLAATALTAFLQEWVDASVTLLGLQGMMGVEKWIRGQRAEARESKSLSPNLQTWNMRKDL